MVQTAQSRRLASAILIKDCRSDPTNFVDIIWNLQTMSPKVNLYHSHIIWNQFFMQFQLHFSVKLDHFYEVLQSVSLQLLFLGINSSSSCASSAAPAAGRRGTRWIPSSSGSLSEGHPDRWGSVNVKNDPETKKTKKEQTRNRHVFFPKADLFFFWFFRVSNLEIVFWFAFFCWLTRAFGEAGKWQIQPGFFKPQVWQMSYLKSWKIESHCFQICFFSAFPCCKSTPKSVSRHEGTQESFEALTPNEKLLGLLG